MRRRAGESNATGRRAPRWSPPPGRTNAAPPGRNGDAARQRKRTMALVVGRGGVDLGGRRAPGPTTSAATGQGCSRDPFAGQPQRSDVVRVAGVAARGGPGAAAVAGGSPTNAGSWSGPAGAAARPARARRAGPRGRGTAAVRYQRGQPRLCPMSGCGAGPPARVPDAARAPPAKKAAVPGRAPGLSCSPLRRAALVELTVRSISRA